MKSGFFLLAAAAAAAGVVGATFKRNKTASLTVHLDCRKDHSWRCRTQMAAKRRTEIITKDHNNQARTTKFYITQAVKSLSQLIKSLYISMFNNYFFPHTPCIPLFLNIIYFPWCIKWRRLRKVNRTSGMERNKFICEQKKNTTWYNT